MYPSLWKITPLIVLGISVLLRIFGRREVEMSPALRNVVVVGGSYVGLVSFVLEMGFAVVWVETDDV